MWRYSESGMKEEMCSGVIQSIKHILYCNLVSVKCFNELFLSIGSFLFSHCLMTSFDIFCLTFLSQFCCFYLLQLDFSSLLMILIILLNWNCYNVQKFEQICLKNLAAKINIRTILCTLGLS